MEQIKMLVEYTTTDKQVKKEISKGTSAVKAVEKIRTRDDVSSISNVFKVIEMQEFDMSTAYEGEMVTEEVVEHYFGTLDPEANSYRGIPTDHQELFVSFAKVMDGVWQYFYERKVFNAKRKKIARFAF